MPQPYHGKLSTHDVLGLFTLVCLLTAVTASPILSGPLSLSKRAAVYTSTGIAPRLPLSADPVALKPVPIYTSPPSGEFPQPEILETFKSGTGEELIPPGQPKKRQNTSSCPEGLIEGCCDVKIPHRTREVPNDSSQDIATNLMPRNLQKDLVARQLLADNSCGQFQVPCCVPQKADPSPNPLPKSPDGGPVSQVVGDGDEENLS